MGVEKKPMSMFQLGAKAIARYRNGDDSLYFCPICGRGFDKDAAQNGELSVEHVPIKRIGGKKLLLTCRQCNSTKGHTIDAAVSSREDLNDFIDIIKGDLDNISAPTTLEIGGLTLKVSITQTAGVREIRIADEANNPESIHQFRKHMKSVGEQGLWNGHEFKLSRRVKLDQRLLKLGDLKSAYLLIFVWLGYRYAFDNRLVIVREQIIKPEEEILGTRFWFALKEGGAPPQSILYVSEPLPFFLVTFDQWGIILPAFESPPDLYSLLPKVWQKDEAVSINAVFLASWPDTLTMYLDFHDNLNES